MNDWIDWHGGDCPVGPDVRVEVEFRDGDKFAGLSAVAWEWTHDDDPGDIIRYRILDTALDRMAEQEPLYLLHCGKIDSSGEQDEFDVEADSWKRVEEFCRQHPGETVRLYAAPVAPRVDCNTCANRGKIDGPSQEIHCDHCNWQEQWRTDHYMRAAAETPEKEDGK